MQITPLRFLFVVVSLALALGGCSQTEPEPEARQRVLLGGGSSAGECSGYCSRSVTITGPEIELTARFTDGRERAEDVNRGQLTEIGLAAVGSLVADLEYDDEYGCPDCDDGGASSLNVDGQWIRFESGEPPTGLAGAAAFVTSLASSLTRCEVSDLVVPAADCAPLTRESR